LFEKGVFNFLPNYRYLGSKKDRNTGLKEKCHIFRRKWAKIVDSQFVWKMRDRGTKQAREQFFFFTLVLTWVSDLMLPIIT
jgi:hypothetical protein